MAQELETNPDAGDPDAVDASDLLPGLKAVGHETLAERVYRGLRDFLMEGGAQPGQKLTLRQLTKVFGTSPMPVRAAVQRLAAEGALEALPARAICVPPMTTAKLLEMRRIRVALESIAVEEAVAHVTDADIARLERLQAAFREKMRLPSEDPRQLFRDNKEFHFALYGVARMPLLMSMIENIWVQVGPVLHLSLRGNALLATDAASPDHHDEILEGLRRRDVEATRRALVDDVMNAFRLIMRGGDLPG